ncbi:MAG: helix-turn-helix domain-containing protein [Clostridia bacterium]|nr:helix-turn-helix domain-containing protein [Clostridia bacterium]
MCRIMIVDENSTSRGWLLEAIKASFVSSDHIILSPGTEDASVRLQKHEIDIVLTRIDSCGDPAVAFSKSIKDNHLFTIVVGYGNCRDFNFLLDIMRNGVSQYASNFYDREEMVSVLNKAYENYRRLKMEVRLEIEKEKIKNNKVFSAFLDEWAADFCRNAMESDGIGIRRYIDAICHLIDGQALMSSKSMILELMISLSARLEKHRLKLPMLPLDDKEHRALMSAGSTAQLKEWFEKSMAGIARLVGDMTCTGNVSMLLLSAVRYIKENYNRDISRDEVANRVNLAPCYFSQVFKQTFGESFVEYVRKIRIEKAKHLLQSTDYQNSKISTQVGYNDSKYFTKVFRAYTGLTPCDYKKMLASARQYAQ